MGASQARGPSSPPRLTREAMRNAGSELALHWHYGGEESRWEPESAGQGGNLVLARGACASAARRGRRKGLILGVWRMRARAHGRRSMGTIADRRVNGTYKWMRKVIPNLLSRRSRPPELKPSRCLGRRQSSLSSPPPPPQLPPFPTPSDSLHSSVDLSPLWPSDVDVRGPRRGGPIRALDLGRAEGDRVQVDLRARPRADRGSPGPLGAVPQVAGPKSERARVGWGCLLLC